MERPTCLCCLHYRQHYIFDGRQCVAVNCGHCTHLRPKHRKPNSNACSHYIPSPTTEQDRAYELMTAELLRYLLTRDPPQQE